MQHKAGLFALILSLGLSHAAWSAEVRVSCGAVGKEREFCERAANAWAQKTGNTVSITSPPEETNQRYRKYLIELGDANNEADVYQIDIIWPGLLGNYFVDLKDYIDEADIQRHHPAIIEANTVDGRLVGMPWFTDVGLLYYRKDLLEKHDLEVPESWAELAETALFIQSQERTAGADEFWGLVFQGNAYEGLTCNALEWIGAYGGGTILGEDGQVTINNPQATFALAQAASWIESVTPRRVLSFNETDSLNAFANGSVVFMRNWPYAWGLLNDPQSPVAGKVDVAPLPKGGRSGHSASTLGGWQLAVAKSSGHPAEAADLVRYLTSEAVQKQRAVEGAYAPTIMSLYDDPEVLEANPFFAKLRPILEHAIARPSNSAGPQYMALTTHFWEAVHDALEGKYSAADSLARLEDRLRLLRARADSR